MKKQVYLYKRLLALSACFILAFALTACGKTGSDKSDDEEETVEEEDDDEDSDTEIVREDKNRAYKADPAEGEWEFVYTLYHSEYGDGSEYDSCMMASDEYAPEAKIKVTKKDGDFIADYKYYGYESDTRYYGNRLKYNDGAPYEGAEDSDWYLEFDNPFGDSEDDMRLTMTDENTLVMVHEYKEESPEDDYSYYALYRDVYIRKDDPRLNDPEELRYFDTVTVSNVNALLNDIQNNRKIILESGTYDLSEVDYGRMTNKHVTSDWDGYTISDVSNLCIEAAEGADVLICVDDAYCPVLNFKGCSNLVIRNVTAGHTVEPGYCSGSVFDFSDSSCIDIFDSRLYGCGTYGVEAYSCSKIMVKNTEIYECTYGLVSLRDVYMVRFDDCVMRDSSDLSMIDIASSYDIVFNDCEFKNNRVTSEYSTVYFVELYEYSDATFNNCTFTDNEYKNFSNNKVKMNNCTVNDKNGDLTNVEFDGDEDASALKLSYKEACDAQEQINLRFQVEALDQLTMNQICYEEYTMWDKLLNDIWAYLKNTLDEDKMEALTEEELNWLKEKEAAVAAAGAQVEGGSMQPQVEYGTAAALTRERVEILMDKYVK